MLLYKLVQIRDPLKCIELISKYVILQESIKDLDPPQIMWDFFISKKVSFKLKVKPPV